MKRKISMLIVLLTVILSTTVYGARFSDVEEKHWAKSYIDKMAAAGIINGFEDGTFRPSENITREQFAKILVLSLDLKEKELNIKYEDVEDGRWSKEYIEIAAKYLTGYAKDGKYYFKPDEPCLREDIAVAGVMAKGLQNQVPNYDLLKNFSDEGEISERLRKYVAIAVENKIMIGDGVSFGAQSSITRAEVSKVVCNISEKLQAIETTNIVYGDVDGDGKVTSNDRVTLTRHLEGWKGYEVIDEKAADVDGDGKVTERDRDILAKFLAGDINELPHKCTKNEEKFERIDDKNHKKTITCKCGAIISEVVEAHKFVNGKCVCGYEGKVEEILYGDVDGDGVVTKEDAVLLIGHVGAPFLDIYKLNNPDAADVNQDGELSMQDPAIIVNYLDKKGVTKLPHICKEYTKVEYKSKDSKTHERYLVCPECGYGKKGTEPKTETHKFVNGKCVCGYEETTISSSIEDAKRPPDAEIILPKPNLETK